MNPTQALPPAPTQEEWTTFLQQVLTKYGCVSGTLHRLDAADGMLKLMVSERIPESLLGVISVIPVGKGIAGAAAERREPVELCNLQTDASGVAKPGAKATGVQGSIAVPLLNGNQLRGTLGIGKMEPYDFTDAEKGELMQIGREIAGRV